MMPAWYQRMTQRERRLAMLVAGALFLLINLLVWSKLFSVLANARAELALRKATREEQSIYIKEKDLWARRDQWLKQHLIGTGRQFQSSCHRCPFCAQIPRETPETCVSCG